MTSNKRVVWKFFNAKATNAIKISFNLCSNEFLRGRSDEKTCKMSKAGSSCSDNPEDTRSTQLTLEETLSLKKI